MNPSFAASIPAPVLGVYPHSAPGQDVELFVGDLSIGEVTAPGRIWLRMTGDLGFCWKLDEPVHHFWDLNESLLRFDHPVYGQLAVAATLRSSDGSGSVVGTEIGEHEPLDEVIVHWMNVPEILRGEALALPGKQWLGRWRSTAGGWQLLLDPPIEHNALFRAAKDRPLHVMTHTGSLRRTDGGQFTLVQASEALSAWQVALSFAVGNWVAPHLAVGLRGGERVAEQWRPWRCCHASAPQAWWDTHRSDDLTEFTEAFVEAWYDADRHDTVRHYAMHIIEANRSGGLEARIMMLGAATEYLSWVRHVIGGTRSKSDHSQRSAVENLRESLTESGISIVEPADLAAIQQLIAEKATEGLRLDDGPGVIAWVRNKLVHPKDAGQPYRIEGLLADVWSLFLQYAELLLLAEVGYRGEYRKRFPPGRWAHTSYPVPWATDDGPGERA